MKKISLSLISVIYLFASQSFADSADYNCRIVMRGAKIFKQQGVVTAQIDVSKQLLQAYPGATVFLRVANRNGVQGIIDIPAWPIAGVETDKFQQFNIQFEHKYNENLHLGILAGIRVGQSNLFDWNWQLGASYGMIYINDQFSPRESQCQGQ